MVDRALLMIADISGYTQYMRLHRMSLAHSQEITGRLLKSMVRAAPRLDLIEIEGDAAFLYALIDNEERSPVPETLDLALCMHRAFHAEQDRMIGLDMCSCPGCIEAGRLRVKFVAHTGEVAKQRIRRRTQLVGVDVIAVHRMLKNSVPAEEYVLMTEPVFRQSPSLPPHAVNELEEDLEGLGRTKVFYFDLQVMALDPETPLKRTLIRRLRVTSGIALRGMPRMIRPRDRDRSLTQ